MRIATLVLAGSALALAACGGSTGDEPSDRDDVENNLITTTPGDRVADPETPELVEAPELQPIASLTSPERAVMIGQDGPQFDACGGYGQVTGLNPAGDNYLSVRSLPQAGSAELDRLGPDAGVIMCETVNGFHGIVYSGEGKDDLDCQAGANLDAPEPYSGPCRSGWVSEDFITLIAG